jgi:cephalosporin hydroxylase
MRPLKALRHPRKALLYALLGPRDYRRLVADKETASRTDWLAGQLGEAVDVTERFHLLSYYSGVVQQTYWLGVPVQKSPLDCWIYQEIITELRPDVIIETGTDLGGSALFLASICDAVGRGHVVSVDVRPSAQIRHPRVTFLVGDSTSEPTLNRIRDLTRASEQCMVILDSDHTAEHVGRELRAYREFVTIGSYMVVEDTNINGHPVLPDHGPGPLEAVRDFIAEDRDFEIDKSREKFLLTYFPNGFLKRVDKTLTR